jgi:hypothetical protein
MNEKDIFCNLLLFYCSTLLTATAAMSGRGNEVCKEAREEKAFHFLNNSQGNKRKRRNCAAAACFYVS